MINNSSSSKTIARNTIILYFRMLVTMVVSLYTSRVILQMLGVDDYGLYQSVGGIVGFLVFVNNALATGTSRFITYALGEGHDKKLRTVFSTTMSIHIALGLLIVIFAETVGLWFLYHKLVIPPERMSAAVYCYHLSIITAFISITQVPYNALIISRERMNVFAYASIVDVILKLAIVYVLCLSPFDKLKLYATLYLIISVSIMMFYRGYCLRRFKESHYHIIFDKQILKEIGAFSGWSLFANGAMALNKQGILVLINMFFEPSVVAARAISMQVNNVVIQFVQNFRTAINPQITKRWASGDIVGSKELVITSAKISYFLVLMIALPVLFTTDELLHLWLEVVPEYTIVFVRLILIQSLFSVWDWSLYQALYAKGQLRENALISPTIGFCEFILCYVLFRMGCSPVVASYVAIVSPILLSLIVKPILLIKIVGYKWQDFIQLYPACIYVTVVAVPLPLAYFLLIYPNITSEWGALLSMITIAGVSVFTSVWFLGLTSVMRQKVIYAVRCKINR